MIEVKKAGTEHIKGIINVCSEGYRDTYKETHANTYIERVIAEFYHHDRILKEITHTSSDWNGWYVAIEGHKVVGAIGGGLISKEEGEIFVLYLDPNRRGEGIGTKLLQGFTDVQRENGAKKQWVSVAKGNEKGIPFYEARKFEFVKEQESFGNTEGEGYLSWRYCRSV
ncbi:GNAT family N-acetyltransferase [[Bacillus] enclensis]|uniref:GNAT family N-acetyltransferase n=1 Tax=[Bacillus] enclensis TaxID=1402860 RepID=UPI0018DEBF77|nr:GNAT family N-acetyltransferase [[Bacillus] enclensis]MBH9964844.1 GNAT family N-acetyltransferase [[Bacillus] enclensis]QWC21176.1 GNAT family N-acetyltransferase [Bacillus haikouensis]